jgi:hypothetical protein
MNAGEKRFLFIRHLGRKLRRVWRRDYA